MSLHKKKSDLKDNKDMPWGSVLVDGMGRNKDSLTMLHHVVQKYSDIAVPNLEFLFGKDLIYILCLLFEFFF